MTTLEWLLSEYKQQLVKEKRLIYITPGELHALERVARILNTNQQRITDGNGSSRTDQPESDGPEDRRTQDEAGGVPSTT